MPTSKHIIIQASAATVMFISALPLGDAIEAVALRASDHDFPPLNKTTREDVGGSATVICTFSAGEENSEACEENLDPLEDFHDTTVTELLDVIDAPDRKLFSSHEWQAAGEALKKFCPAVRVALQRKFGKFTKMCHKYLRVSRETVKTAEVRGWQFLTRGTFKHVYPPEWTHSSSFFA
ncbi:hypothetical protein FOZ61_002719 [Perkinsus olseni]|uniref:Uncharacterized protein n=1 Tax=Perkinsus olseni TaxID=32597 RepID=A0A7J6LS17_PEROL|nr:hypothetical protein FOZ61_002719 [Perkinsus olseni]